MLLMALFGAAVLALVCWVALRESDPAANAVIPQLGPESQVGGPHDGHAPPPPVAGVKGAPPGELDDATVADADTEEALAAAAALWTVLTQARG